MRAEFEKIPPAESSSIHINNIDTDFFDPLWHYHPEIEITFIIQGEGMRFVGDQAEKFSSYDLVAIGPQIPHHWKSENDKPGAKAIVLQFQTRAFGEVFWDLPELFQIKEILKEMRFGLSFKANDDTLLLFENVVNSNQISRLSALLNILDHLVNLEQRRLLNVDYYLDSELPENRLEKIYFLVKQHFKENFKIQDYASKVGFTKESFSRYFKQKTGQVFVDYLNNYRITYASLLLQETDMKIIEVAFESGFQNLSNFNRQFRKIKDRSPLEYRKWIVEQKQNYSKENPKR